MRDRLVLRPCTRDWANDFIREHHRHHGPVVGYLWALGAWVRSTTGAFFPVGVAVVGRPVARALWDGVTAEVTRLATDGERNACSFLYGACRRTILAHGFVRGLTYILASESGVSLRAAGWTKGPTVKGRSWSCASRPRVDKHPTVDKVRWQFGEWESVGAREVAA